MMKQLSGRTVLARRGQFEAVEDARLVECAAVECALAHFHARHDVALRADAVVDAEPPLPPFVGSLADQQLGVVVRRQPGQVVDEHIGALHEAAIAPNAIGGGSEGVAVGVELEGDRAAVPVRRRNQGNAGHGEQGR
jgi:hypothetical protein